MSISLSREELYSIIRDQIKTNEEFDDQDVIDGNVEWRKVMRNLNDSVTDIIELMIEPKEKKKWGKTDIIIKRNCASHQFCKALQSKPNDIEFEGYLKSCMQRKPDYLISLFEKPDQQRKQNFNPKTRDFLAVYCDSYGWNDFRNSYCKILKENKELKIESKYTRGFNGRLKETHTDIKKKREELIEFIKHILSNKDFSLISGDINLKDIESFLKVNNEWLTYTIYNPNLKSRLENLLNKSEEQYLEQINNHIIIDQNNYAIELFFKIINEKNLSLPISLELESFFRFNEDATRTKKLTKTEWYNKVLLINAIIISHLSYNCEKKIEFLLEILLIKEENVWEKALLGIVLEFYIIQSINNERIFNRFEIIKNTLQPELGYTRLAIIYALGGEHNFFGDLILIEQIKKQSNNTFFKNQCDFFIPLHKEHSFFNQVPQVSNRDSFIDLICWSPYESLISKSHILSLYFEKDDFLDKIDAGISYFGMYKDSMDSFEKHKVFVNKHVGDSVLANCINFFLGIQIIPKDENKQDNIISSNIYLKIFQYAYKEFSKVFYGEGRPNYDWLDVFDRSLESMPRQTQKMESEDRFKIIPKYDGINLNKLTAEGKMKNSYIIKRVLNYKSQSNPNDYSLYNQIGIINEKSSTLKEAIQAYQKSSSINPNQVKPWQRWINILIEEKEYEKAITVCDKALGTVSKYEDIWCEKIRIFRLLDKTNETVKLCNQALIVNPRFSYVIMNKGVVLDRMNKKKLAIQCYEEAVKVNNRNIDFKFRLGWSYFTLGYISKARKQFETIIESNKQHKHAHMNLGHCELILKNEQKAIKNYQKSLELWGCSEEFFEGFEDDFQYIKPHKISEKEYQEIKQEFREYCKNRKEKKEK